MIDTLPEGYALIDRPRGTNHEIVSPNASSVIILPNISTARPIRLGSPHRPILPFHQAILPALLLLNDWRQ